MSHGKGDPQKVVLAAMAGNGAITIAKLIAAILSGSVAMLAESVHSLADTTNQALLLMGIKLSARHDPKRFPFGRSMEAYFWPFLVALILFFLGGVYAIWEGVHRLMHGGPPGSAIGPLIVLGVSMLMEIGSFWVALREFNKSRGDRPVLEALFQSRDPTIPVVLLEDAAALAGLVVAAISVAVTWATGSSIADGIGSIVIGLILCSVGAMLAWDTHGLLIGESATPEMRKTMLDVALGTPGVEAVTQALTLHLGPETILCALKVRFRAGISVAELEGTIDALEERVRVAVPHMKKIFVEPDSDYDAKLDPDMSGQ